LGLKVFIMVYQVHGRIEIALHSDWFIFFAKFRGAGNNWCVTLHTHKIPARNNGTTTWELGTTETRDQEIDSIP
jgi:hypothetical protein